MDIVKESDGTFRCRVCDKIYYHGEASEGDSCPNADEHGVTHSVYRWDAVCGGWTFDQDEFAPLLGHYSFWGALAHYRTQVAKNRDTPYVIVEDPYNRLPVTLSRNLSDATVVLRSDAEEPADA